MNKNHSKFQKHLRDSKNCVFLAARIMNDKGYDVVIPANKIAPTHEQWKTYKDDGDIFIRLKCSNYSFRRVEVKGLSCDFTGQDDWPFGSTAIVCAKHAYDSAVDKPIAIMFFNKKRSIYGIIKSDTYNDWATERRKDSRYDNYGQEFYLCPIALIRFESVEADQ